MVIGGSGAGKSTLARALSDKLGILSYDVDRVIYRDGRGTPTSPCVRAAFVDRLAAEERWILDCGHVGWVEPLFARADQFVWLDGPRLAVARQLFKRELIDRREPGRVANAGRLLRKWWRFYFDSRGDRNDGDGVPLTRASLVAELGRFADRVRRHDRGRRALDALVPAGGPAAASASVAMAHAAAEFVRAHDPDRSLWLWFDADDPYRAVYLAVAAASVWTGRILALDLPARTDVATGRRHVFPLGERVALLASSDASLDAAMRRLELQGIRPRPVARRTIASGRESFEVVIVEASPSPAASIRELPPARLQPDHGTVEPQDGGARVVTPPAPWHYAAALDLDSTVADVADRVGYLHLKATLEHGPVGVGVLSRDASSFLTRRALALDGAVDVYLPIARLGDAGSVVVQSWDRPRRGSLVIEALEIVAEAEP